MKTKIHINKQVIQQNLKNGEWNAPITCKTYKDNIYCKGIDILDKNGNIVAKVIGDGEKQLSCGARVWIETENEVVCHE